MKYKILQLFTLCTILGISTLYAQDKESSKKFSGAILLGNGIYLSDPVVPTSPGTTDWTVNGYAPVASSISNTNSITNMAGAEFRLFVSDNFSL